MAVLTPQHQQRLDDAAYVFRILEAGAPHPVPNHPVAGSDGTFPLPIPPQSLRPQQNVRVNIMETRDGAISDEQGTSPPQWEISGQFTITPTIVNGASLDHYQAQRALETYFRYYATTNLERAKAQKSLLTLEYHDFYAGEHWTIAPQVIPLGERESSRPTTERYTLRFRGLRPVNAAPRPVNTARDALNNTNPNASIGLICPVEAA